VATDPDADRQKLPIKKKYRSVEISCFEVLNVHFGVLSKASSFAYKSFVEIQLQVEKKL
jgi:hypothetical protein